LLMLTAANIVPRLINDSMFWNWMLIISSTCC
jgi:hypothetical protein